MTWKTAYLETRVLSADPVELVGISYEYAMLRVQDARRALAAGDIAARSCAISKAVAIIGELEGSLNHELGGEIAFNLRRLYQYMRERLALANLKQTDAPLGEVESLLKTIGEGWQGIGPVTSSGDDRAARSKPAEWSAFPAVAIMAEHSTQSWSA